MKKKQRQKEKWKAGDLALMDCTFDDGSPALFLVHVPGPGRQFPQALCGPPDLEVSLEAQAHVLAKATSGRIWRHNGKRFWEIPREPVEPASANDGPPLDDEQP